MLWKHELSPRLWNDSWLIVSSLNVRYVVQSCKKNKCERYLCCYVIKFSMHSRLAFCWYRQTVWFDQGSRYKAQHLFPVPEHSWLLSGMPVLRWWLLWHLFQSKECHSLSGTKLVLFLLRPIVDRDHQNDYQKDYFYNNVHQHFL